MTNRGWWTISGDAFLEALIRAHSGEDPNMIYTEYYVNSNIETNHLDDQSTGRDITDMQDWYIVDIRTNKIVNCIATSNPKGPDMHNWESYHEAANDPPRYMLENYRYFWERP